jgi:hypothetical protein
MDALVLDIAVRILQALSIALLAWGGWLCIGGTSPRQGAETTGTAERSEALIA